METDPKLCFGKDFWKAKLTEAVEKAREKEGLSDAPTQGFPSYDNCIKEGFKAGEIVLPLYPKLRFRKGLRT